MKWNDFVSEVFLNSLCRSCFFCSRDCCLCTKHQSVKELRHAGSKGKNKHKESQTKATKNHKQTNHKNKTPQPHNFPLQQVKQVKQVRRKLHRIRKQLVQHCCEAADILHEREWEHTNESQTIADEGQVPENDQANQTTKQHRQPKHHQNKPNKKPQPNKRKQQNQPFTLVRRKAQVARPGLEQSKKKLTRMHRHALRL